MLAVLAVLLGDPASTLGAPSWLVEFLSNVSAWDLLLIAAAVAALVVFIKKKAWRTVIAVARGVISFAQILEAVQGLPGFIQRTDDWRAAQDAWRAEQTEKVDQIHHEVHFNNGSSVKDATSRIEEGVAGLYGEVSEVKSRLDQLTESDRQQWDAIHGDEHHGAVDPDHT